MRPQLIPHNKMELMDAKKSILKDIINSILISFNLPQNMWEEVMLLVNYILNKVSCKERDR